MARMPKTVDVSLCGDYVTTVTVRIVNLHWWRLRLQVGYWIMWFGAWVLGGNLRNVGADGDEQSTRDG